MSTFYTKAVPILVMVNFLCSSDILIVLPEIDYTEWVEILWSVVIIFAVNLVTIVKANRKWKSDFSIMGYVIFVVILPCIVPYILALILLGFNWATSHLGIYGGLV
jgi:hypothetical protein